MRLKARDSRIGQNILGKKMSNGIEKVRSLSFKKKFLIFHIDDFRIFVRILAQVIDI